MTYFVRNGERLSGDLHIDDVVIPYGNFRIWSESDLAAYGITKHEDPPPPPVQISEDVVKNECKRRIFDHASATTQSNMNGEMNRINAKLGLGQTLTAEEQATIVLFGQAMAWIKAMRDTVPGLVGKQDFNKDENWPPLSDNLKAFAARF